jgi:hypothetical protein
VIPIVERFSIANGKKDEKLMMGNARLRHYPACPLLFNYDIWSKRKEARA